MCHRVFKHGAAHMNSPRSHAGLRSYFITALLRAMFEGGHGLMVFYTHLQRCDRNFMWSSLPRGRLSLRVYVHEHMTAILCVVIIATGHTLIEGVCA